MSRRFNRPNEWSGPGQVSGHGAGSFAVAFRAAVVRRAGLLGLLGALWLAARPAQAQQVLLQTNVANDTLPARTGPNRRYFGHLLASYAPVVGGSSLGVAYGPASAEVLLGGRLKRRLTGGLALCADLRYGYLRYNLDPDASRPAPFIAHPEAEQHLAFHQLGSEVSVRLNPGRRRGNVVGRYLDLLAYGGWAFATTYATGQPAPGGGQQETVTHQPPYLARWLGGVGLRVGSNSLALVGRYRLSNAFTTAGLPEPPRLTIGIEAGWF